MFEQAELRRIPMGPDLTLHRALNDGRPGFPGAEGRACQFGHGVGAFTTNSIHSSQWALMVRLMQKKRLKSPRKLPF